MVKRDLVLSPFGGDAAALLRAAIAAEAEGYDGVWTFDHISSLASLGAPGEGASRDPFTLLGAIAASTSRVRLGTLVANIHNRHPAQLALAFDTLADLAGVGGLEDGDAEARGRTVCGIGAGAGPGSPFAREDEALGRALAPAAQRRKLLGEHLAALRAIWEGRDAVGSVATSGLRGVVRHPAPPIIVGGSSNATLRLAAAQADGVNIVTGLGPRLADQVALVRDELSVREAPLARPFEVSVFVADRSSEAAREAEIPDGVDRLTVLVRP